MPDTPIDPWEVIRKDEALARRVYEDKTTPWTPAEFRIAIGHALAALTTLREQMERLTYLHDLDHKLADRWRTQVERQKGQRDGWIEDAVWRVASDWQAMKAERDKLKLQRDGWMGKARALRAQLERQEAALREAENSIETVVQAMRYGQNYRGQLQHIRDGIRHALSPPTTDEPTKGERCPTCDATLRVATKRGYYDAHGPCTDPWHQEAER